MLIYTYLGQTDEEIARKYEAQKKHIVSTCIVPNNVDSQLKLVIESREKEQLEALYADLLESIRKDAAKKELFDYVFEAGKPVSIPEDSPKHVLGKLNVLVASGSFALGEVGEVVSVEEQPIKRRGRKKKAE